MLVYTDTTHTYIITHNHPLPFVQKFLVEGLCIVPAHAGVVGGIGHLVAGVRVNVAFH